MTGTLPSALNMSSSAFLPSGRISSVTAMPRLGGGAQKVAEPPEADLEWLSPALVAMRAEARGETKRLGGGDSRNAPIVPSREEYLPQQEGEWKSTLPRDLWRIKDLGLLLDT